MLKGLEEIEGLTPEQQEAINGLAGGLLSKNEELLSKVAAKDSGNNAALAEMQALKQFKHNADVKAAEDAKNWEEATRLKQEAFDKEKAELAEKANTYESQVKKLLIDDGLSRALDGVSINPALKAGAEAMLRSNANLVDGKAMIGEKSLSDAVNEWAESENGKHFCLAPNNSGGNANGGDSTQGKTGDYIKDKAAEINKKLGR